MRFIANHGGVVHPVNDEELDLHLGLASIPPTREDPRGKPARMATDEEIARWFAAQGLENPFAPVASGESTEAGEAKTPPSKK